jgi:hypothetical protein
MTEKGAAKREPISPVTREKGSLRPGKRAYDCSLIVDS